MDKPKWESLWGYECVISKVSWGEAMRVLKEHLGIALIGTVVFAFFGFVFGYLFSDPQSINSILLDVVKLGLVLMLIFTWFRLKAPIIIMKTELQKSKTELGDLKQQHQTELVNLRQTHENDLNSRNQIISEKDLKLKQLSKELSNLKDSSKAPDLVFQPRISREGLVTPQGLRIGISLVAELQITNTSKFGTNVTAEIHYRDESLGRAMRLTGRWVDEPFLRDESAVVMPIPLRPGQGRRLGIAVKPPLADIWYAMDNKTPFDGYVVENYELLTPTTITVKLIGDKEPVTRYFQLTDEDGVPKFDELQSGVK